MKPYVLTCLLLIIGVARAQEPAPPPEEPQPAEELRLNFQQAPVDTVLDYLSKAAGFVIVRDGPITATVDIIAHEPVSRDEAVELLHGILNDRGYALIRNGRILRVIKRSDAPTRDLPVRTGSDPEAITKSGEIVTQVIPIRHTPAPKLIDTLKPLIPKEAVITANEDSNALVITDTLTNIRRMMEIIEALDTTVASILDIRVMLLEYADAEETATVVNKIFETPTSKQSSQPTDRRAQFFQRMMRSRMGGGEEDDDTATGKEVRQTASHVNAVADTRANAVVVTAPTEILEQIQTLVRQLDVPTEATTALRVFALRYGDATEVATVLTNLYASTTSSTNQQSSRRGGFFGRFQPPQPQAEQTTTQRGSRSLAEAKVTAVADTRTNSVIVSASPTTMTDVADVVKQLDGSPANVPNVYIYHLEHGDVDKAKEILESMFDDLDSSGGTSSSRSTRTTGTQGVGTIRRSTQSTTTGGTTRR